MEKIETRNGQREEWTVRQSMEKILELQDKRFNPLFVLPTFDADHVHFGDRGEIDKLPLDLQQPTLDILNSGGKGIDISAKVVGLHRPYLAAQGIEGKFPIYSTDEDPVSSFAETVVPAGNRWKPEKTVELFSMIDFGIWFKYKDEVDSILRNDPHSSIAGFTPVVTVNTTREKDNPNLYRIDLLTGEKELRDMDRFREYLNLTAWFSFYRDLGIKETCEALVLKDESRGLVEALHAAVEN